MTGCYDCGLKYGGLGWIEAIIPDQIWNDISPTKDQGGILCINCISRRLAEKKYKDIPVWFLGTEPLRPVLGDPVDNKFSMEILRNWVPKKRSRKEGAIK